MISSSAIASSSAPSYQGIIETLLRPVLQAGRSKEAKTALPLAVSELAKELYKRRCPEHELRGYFAAREGGQQWIEFLEKHQVFTLLRGTALSQPSNTPMEPADQPERLVQQNPLSLLKSATRSFIWVGASGTGKTTGMHYIVNKLAGFDPLTHFVILDLQSAGWLGLARFEHTVVFLNGDAEGVVAEAARYVGWVAGQLQDRVLANQRQARLREHKFVRPPIWLVINEWPRIYRFWNSLSAAQLRDIGAANLLNDLITILHSGREEAVGLVLSCHDHGKEAIGLGPNDYASATIIASGRVDPMSREGGYDSLAAAIADSRLIRDATIRAELKQAFVTARKGYEAGAPLVALINGDPVLGYNSIRPDKLQQIDLSANYQYGGWQPPWVKAAKAANTTGDLWQS